MKIVFLASRFPPDFIGGGEWSTKYIAEGLAALGHSVTVFCGAADDAEELVSGVKIKRISALHGLWDKPLFEKRKSAKMAGLLIKELDSNFDVIHAHDFRSAQALALLKLKNSYVTVRDFAPICGTTNNMWFDGKSCDGCTLRNVCLRCHRVREASMARKPFRIWQYKYNLNFRNATYKAIKNHVYISESLRNRISSRFVLPENITIIPNPVNPLWLQSPQVDIKDNKAVVYAGTVDDYKGVNVLLEAFARLYSETKNIELIIVGNGKIDKYKKKIAGKFLDLPVVFTGKATQEGVKKYFDQALVVVQPSVWEEPFGRTIIEAYARGRAVVASDIGGIKETFKEGTGKLVAPSDVAGLYSGLKEIISNPEEAKIMGDLGRKHVVENFTEEIIAKKYEEFYRTVVK